MRGLKVLLGSTALLAGLALAPMAKAQIDVGIGIQPVCSYGYYDYAPYACAPYGFYGPGYFYNGIFLGMGPWANWGYGHGWGGHRFGGAGGGSYRANRNYVLIQHVGETTMKEYPQSAATMILPGDLIRVPERYF